MEKILFAGSTVGEPWWNIGEIVQAALATRGYEVEVTDESFSENNVKFVGTGRAQIGVTVPGHFAAAREGRGAHEGSGVDFNDLRAIATVHRPNWLGFAVRKDLGIASLAEVADRKLGIGLLCGGDEPGGVPAMVLEHYGLGFDQIREWGGRHLRWSGRREGSYVREGVVDVMLGDIYSGYTPHCRFWYEAVVLYDLVFLDLDPSLLQAIATKHWYAHGAIPHGLFPGVDRDIPTVMQNTLTIYCRKDLPDELVEKTVTGLDAEEDLFQQNRMPFYYDRRYVGRSDFLPLHPAAEAAYRSLGIETSGPKL